MGKLIDFTNKKIGHLTVIKRAEQKSIHGDCATWICKCDCGNICIKSSNVLTNNKDSSCGHIHKQKLGLKKRIDLTGMKFGKLQVIQYAYSEKNRAVWKCKCDCGNICFVKGRYLKDGDTKSCGCYVSQCISKLKKKPIIPGTKIGKLTVMYELPQRKNKIIYYHCKCDCGNELDVSSSHLKRKDTKSCGCVHSFPETYISDFLRKNNICFQRQYKFNECKSRKNRKLPFDFAIFNNKKQLQFLIQFQGQQHFKNTFYSSEKDYQEYISHDQQKRNFCINNNIILYEINYKEDLFLKLNEIFQKHAIIQ